ncbi:MAG: PilZ domain-containing protein [Spirochaetia bacterium]
MESESVSERRQLQRFSMKAYAVVKTTSPGAEKMFELCTRDISSGGAFFPMEVPLPTGEKVKITLYLSISVLEKIADLPSKAKIETDGQVVRSTGRGMAVKFAGHYSMSPATL